MTSDYLIWTAFKLFAALPLWLAHSLGVILGNLAYLLPTQLKRVTTINLTCCFPQLTQAARRKLIRRTLIETGKTFMEVGALWLWDVPKTLALIKKVSGEDDFRASLAQGRGAITAGPHLGAWELAGLYLSVNYSITTLYRPPRLAGLAQLVRTARSRGGANLVATDINGVKSLYQTLSRGAVVAILPDHNPGQGMGIFAPFFGILTNTMVLLPRLAHKKNVPVYFVYAERLPRGQGFHLHFIRGDSQIGSHDISLACTHLNAGIEQCINHHPEQYQWSYKRFKIRPAGEPNFYQ